MDLESFAITATANGLGFMCDYCHDHRTEPRRPNSIDRHEKVLLLHCPKLRRLPEDTLHKIASFLVEWKK